jgi:UDP:flavonoid glycosyltransferase YjiC (YdhE family)
VIGSLLTILFMPKSAYGPTKPTIVLPLLWDQYDNAQRMHELGLGIRLDTYRFTDAEMHGAPGRLLDDAGLRERLAVAAAIQRRDGLRKAADLIEQSAVA